MTPYLSGMPVDDIPSVSISSQEGDTFIDTSVQSKRKRVSQRSR